MHQFCFARLVTCNPAPDNRTDVWSISGFGMAYQRLRRVFCCIRFDRTQWYALLTIHLISIPEQCCMGVR